MSTTSTENTAQIAAERLLATEQARGFRELADLVDDYPQIARLLEYALRNVLVPIGNNDDPRGDMALVANAVGKAEKAFDENWAHLNVTFGPIKLSFYAHREQVCERVVTGTETVTREVPDPEALAAVPTTTVTEVVETVRWICTPLLAEAVAS